MQRAGGSVAWVAAPTGKVRGEEEEQEEEEEKDVVEEEAEGGAERAW